MVAWAAYSGVQKISIYMIICYIFYMAYDEILKHWEIKVKSILLSD